MPRAAFWPILTAAALAASGLPALAVEQVTIPFLCRAGGNTIHLTPSEPRSYDIYGRREQDIVTACPRGNQDRCKSWRVHKFDINCAGTRVPWLDVVAAANAMPGGLARARGNTLLVRMDPWWARRDNRRLREFGDDDRRPSDFSYRPTGREREIEMPPGFAPMVGIRGQFSEGQAGTDNGLNRRGYGEQPGRDKEANEGQITRNDLPPVPSIIERPAPPSQIAKIYPPAPTAAVRPKPVPEPKATAEPPKEPKTTVSGSGHTFAKNPAEKPADVKPDPVKAVEPAKTVVAAVEPPKPVNPPAAAAANPTPGTSAIPKIVNAPGAIDPPKPAGPPVITSATSSSGDAAGPNGTQVAGLPEAAIPVMVDPMPTGAISTGVTLGQVLMVAGSMLLLAASALLFMRRQNQSLEPVHADRNISDVWLENSASRDLVPTAPKSAAAHALPLQPDPPVTFDATTAVIAVPVLESWVPSTRDEALQVLGAGPDASADVLKKIVDGLRMSWHPDHAKSAEDYTARHERMRQINVAWDILSQDA